MSGGRQQLCHQAKTAVILMCTFLVWTGVVTAQPGGNMGDSSKAVRSTQASDGEGGIPRGSEATTRATEEWTPLMRAAAAGHEEVVKLLLDRGADVNEREERVGRTALMEAAASGHLATVRLLVKRGADVKATDKRGYSAAMLAYTSGQEDVVNLLESQGASSAKKAVEAIEKFVTACEKGAVEEAQRLLSTGMNVNAGDGGREWATGLLAASENGRLNVVRALLEKGADVNARTDDGTTALMGAVAGGYGEIVKLLLSRGAAIDAKAQDDHGGTALLLAAAERNHPMVSLLVAAGADVNVAGRSGVTPLMEAVSLNDLEMTKLLLAKGADTGALAIDEYSKLNALTLAAYGGSVTMVNLLLQHGADVNGLPEAYGVPLVAAAESGHLDVVRLLLETGADVDARADRSSTSTERTTTPLEAACSEGRAEVVKALLEKGANMSAKKLHTK